MLQAGLGPGRGEPPAQPQAGVQGRVDQALAQRQVLLGDLVPHVHLLDQLQAPGDALLPGRAHHGRAGEEEDRQGSRPDRDDEDDGGHQAVTFTTRLIQNAPIPIRITVRTSMTTPGSVVHSRPMYSGRTQARKRKRPMGSAMRM